MPSKHFLTSAARFASEAKTVRALIRNGKGWPFWLILSVMIYLSCLPFDGFCLIDRAGDCVRGQGYEALKSGWKDLLSGDPLAYTWLANPLLLCSWALFLFRKRKPASYVSFAAFSVSFLFLILLNVHGVNVHGTTSVRLGIGYWLWLASTLCGFISSLLLRLLDARPSTFNTSARNTEKDPTARGLAVVSLIVSVLGLAASGLSAFYTKRQADVAEATLERANEQLTAHLMPDRTAVYQPSSAVVINNEGASLRTRWSLQIKNTSISTNVVISSFSALQTGIHPNQPNHKGDVPFVGLNENPDDLMCPLEIGSISKTNGLALTLPMQLSAGEALNLTIDLRIAISLAAGRYLLGIQKRMSDMDMLKGMCNAIQQNEFGGGCSDGDRQPRYTLDIETTRGHIYQASSTWRGLW